MYRTLSFVTALALLGSIATTPAQAATQDAAIEQCRRVALEEATVNGSEDHRYRGYCISATAEYLATLSGSGQPIDAFGAELATYVVLLTDLLSDRVCRPESEIPRAINMTADASSDAEQAEQIRLIASTVFACDVTATAAIRRPVVAFGEARSLVASPN
jgi:hypothetical protein